MASLYGFILWTATFISTIEREHIVSFPQQQWLHECATVLTLICMQPTLFAWIIV